MEIPPQDLMAPLDEKVTQVLSVATDEARRLENSHIAVEHLLLGVMRLENRGRRWRVRNRTANKLVHQILFTDHNLTIRRVEEIIRRQNVNYVRRYADSPPMAFSADAQHALRLANDETHWMDYHAMTTAHLLLGIVLQPKGYMVTRALKMDPTQVTERLRQRLPKARGHSRYTAPAKVALSLAQEAAQELRHPQLGPEHLLLGLVREGYGVAGKVLKHLGVQDEYLKARVLQMLPSSEQIEIIGLSHNYKRLLDAAGDEVRVRHHQFIGTGHLLACLMRQENDVAVRALRRLNVKPSDVNEQIAPYLSLQFPLAEAVEDGDLAFLDHVVRVSPDTQAVFEAAVEEAHRLDHREVNTGHVLMGILIASEDQIIAVLDTHGVNRRRVRGLVELMTSQTYPYSLKPRRLGGELKHVIAQATHERDVLDTLSLLAAIIAKSDCLAVKILKQLRVNLETLR